MSHKEETQEEEVELTELKVKGRYLNDDATPHKGDEEISPENKKGDEKDCCTQCIGERMPISKLEEREARHDVKNRDRKCTDCFCFLIYTIFCIFWLAVAVAAFYFGNLWALTHGTDYEGRLCGYDEGVLNKSLVAYPRLNRDLVEWAQGFGQDLLSLDISALSFDQLFSINVTGICVEECPTIGEVICSHQYLVGSNNQLPSFNDVSQCNNGDPFASEYLLGLFNIYSVENSFLCSHCWIAPLNSTEIFNRCIDIIFTTTSTDEKCIFPSNTSISADDPNCQTKEVQQISTSVEPTYENPIAELLGRVAETLYGWGQSAETTWFVIISLGVVGAVLLGFFYVIFMRFCAGFVVWTTVFAIILVAFAFGSWCFVKSGWLPTEWVANLQTLLAELGIVYDFLVSDSANDTYEVLAVIDLDVSQYTQILSDAWKVAAVVMVIVVLILIVLTIVFANKINVAIALIEEASSALLRLPCVVGLPFVTSIVIIVFSAWGVFLLLMIGSLENFTVGTVLDTFQFEQYFDNCTVNNDTLQDFNYTNNDNVDLTEFISDAACYTITFVKKYDEFALEICMVFYHLFMYLWTVQFIHAVMICIVAGAICDWYWTRPSGEKKVKGGDGEWGDPLCHSCTRTFRFHLGSLLFGSFIVAIVQIIRYIMAYIDRQTQSWQRKSKCLRCMFKIVHCCLCCFERCIKYITKNAYIMVAMEGHPFCDSCCHSMKLMLRNIIQFAIFNVFSQVIMMIGKIFIIAVVGGCSYAWITYSFTGLVTTTLFPTILCMLLAWFTSMAFLHVYDLTMATIILCFCEDYEIHKNGLEREALMSKKLQTLVLKNVKHPHVLTKEEIAEEIKEQKHGREMKRV